jgi:hypothetical protein
MAENELDSNRRKKRIFFAFSIFLLLLGFVVIAYYGLGENFDPLGAIVGAILILIGFVGFTLIFRGLLFNS